MVFKDKVYLPLSDLGVNLKLEPFYLKVDNSYSHFNFSKIRFWEISQQVFLHFQESMLLPKPILMRIEATSLMDDKAPTLLKADYIRLVGQVG